MRTPIMLTIHTTDHEDLVHIHCTIQDQEVIYFLEGDYFDDLENNRLFDKDAQRAISTYCQKRKGVLTNYYNEGKGSHGNNQKGKKKVSKTKKSARKQQESLVIATPQTDSHIGTHRGQPWIVRKVTPQDDYTLLLQFNDGTKGVFDMWPIIKQEDGGTDAFAHLINLNEFMKAYVYLHSVFWPGDISVAPETLYKECMTIQEYEDWCADDEGDAEYEEE